VTPCAIYTVHVDMRNVCFLVEPQNQGRRFISGFARKTTGTVFSDLTSKPVVTVSPGFASKPVVEGFFVWVSKLSRLWFIGCATKPTGARRRGTRVEM
jgi:hypothetical protein